MKYKLMGLAMSLIMIFCAVAASAIESREGPYRWHQHMEARGPSEDCSCSGEELCTHLPLIVIDTYGEEIPGEPIEASEVKETGEYNEFTTASDGSSNIACSIKVMDSSVGNNHPSDKPELESEGRIRIRGNTSREFDKKGYLLETTKDDYLTNRNVEMMGMDSHHEWAMHGPYMDKSLIRNYMWYNISGEIMDYAPNVRFCEVILNGEYIGLYVMTETITNGNDSRLNMTEGDDRMDSVSYCIRQDRGSSNPVKNIDTFSTYAYRNKHVTDIVYPGAGRFYHRRLFGI